MKTQLSRNDPQDAAWQQRVMDLLRSAFQPVQWLLARVNTSPDVIDGAKAGAQQRRSVVITVRSSYPLGASASHTSWSARQTRRPTGSIRRSPALAGAGSVRPPTRRSIDLTRATSTGKEKGLVR